MVRVFGKWSNCVIYVNNDIEHWITIPRPAVTADGSIHSVSLLNEKVCFYCVFNKIRKKKVIHSNSIVKIQRKKTNTEKTSHLKMTMI